MLRNSEKIWIGVLVVLLVFLCFGLGTLVIVNYDNILTSQVTKTSQPMSTPTMMVPTVVLPTQTPVKVFVTATPVPSATPKAVIPTPLMNSFIFKGIDLSSGLPTSLTFVLSDGTVITSPWNRALAYKAEDDPTKVFGPGADSIYTHTRDMVITWLHSGTWQGRKIFATDLERYVRLDGSRTLRLEESQARVLSLKTARVYLCQLDGPNLSGEVCLPGKADFPGKIIELMVAAGTVVPHDMLNEYEANTEHSREWLASNFPGSGFELLTKEDSWLIKTCVNILDGQNEDGTPTYLFNRLAIGFIVK